MLRPGTPVEDKRPSRFRPPHCPWKECPDHTLRRGYRCSHDGSYRRRCDPHRRVPRFRCATCGRGFSRQSFSTTYYLKRPELLPAVAAGLVAGSAHRQIARSLGCAGSTVTRLSARLGRHALLLQATALGHLRGLEPVVFDHFETFVYSQDDRLGIGTSVGHRSAFFYGVDPAPHQRMGRRSARRRPPRHELPERVPQSFVDSARRSFELLERLFPGGFELISDDHPAYRAARRKCRSKAIRHSIYPNPPRGPGADSQVARRRDRAMYPVDFKHKLWRHTDAHQRRETIAFGRRSNAVLERAAVFMVWCNFVKLDTERRASTMTPAMKVGVAARRWTWPMVLARRLFPGRIDMPPGWMKIYRREWITPAVGRNLTHESKQAY